ncbi:distal tail protein Dit [Bacillus changyiensis]|uniref:distal tail protein Dit n=1 Tax=Bacillus changyiensis TaxID=3004103 RepID=UPI0022DFEC8E|nr:distal tail protein Dit [Bacillus changyiensis]MDA1478357.1 phage tail family protein [Bacillus changyiensis]
MIDYKKILTTATKDTFGQTLQPVEFTITFNSIILTDYFFVIDVRGRGILGREINLVSLSGIDGAKLKNVRYPERVIEIDTLFMAGSAEELRKILEEINYILATEKEKPLVFSDELDRTYYAIFSTAQENEEKNGMYKVTLTFVCPDPEKEGGETIVTTETNSPTVIKNDGKRVATPTVTCVFESEASTYEIQLLKEDGTINKRIKVKFNFVQGDTLVIDFDKRKVIISDKVNMNALLMLSRWFDIPVGECTVNTTHKSNIAFRKAYI